MSRSHTSGTWTVVAIRCLPSAIQRKASGGAARRSPACHCYAAPVYPFQPADVEKADLRGVHHYEQAKHSLVSLSCSLGAHGPTLLLYPVLATHLHVE